MLDFSTLLPGPLATLILAEAGAEVIKIERPERGDGMRKKSPRFGDDGVEFALLNRGKHSLVLDLKSSMGHRQAREMIAEADVLIEQFRPGVMRRLALDYEKARDINPRIIYCSITGYGQDGHDITRAGHDLNYLAETGILRLTSEVSLPPVAIADIAGGAYPAVMNILLGLRLRELTNRGCHLDISMTDNLFTFLFSHLGSAITATDQWGSPGTGLTTGGSPRYQIYETADGQYLAAAPLEASFWAEFCDIVGLEAHLRAGDADPGAVRNAVARRIRAMPAKYWQSRFLGRDACAVLVSTLKDAFESEHFRQRGLFEHQLVDDQAGTVPALPVPVCADFRGGMVADYPRLNDFGNSTATHSHTTADNNVSRMDANG